MKVASLTLAALLLCGTGLPAQSQIVQRILVKVNGEIFTQTDLVKRQTEALRDKGFKPDQPDDKVRAAMIEVTPEILLDAVDQLLMVQRGRELGYKLTDAQFTATLDRIKKQFNLDDAGLKAGLEQEGYSLTEYRRISEQQFIFGQVQQHEVLLRSQITDEEARQYYDKHKSEFLTPATVTLLEISISVPTDSKGQYSVGADEDAKAKVTAARERAAKGEDYAKLITEVSESPNKATGGRLGPVVITDIDPNLRAKLEPLAIGQISEPIRMARGYSIFKMDEKSTSLPQPFSAVREDILQKIYEARVDAETLKYLTKLRTQALIEWKDEALHKAYDKALADRSAAAK